MMTNKFLNDGWLEHYHEELVKVDHTIKIHRVLMNDKSPLDFFNPLDFVE